MNTTKDIKREEVLARWKAAREKRRMCIAQLEKSMREAYKKQTGKEARKLPIFLRYDYAVADRGHKPPCTL